MKKAVKIGGVIVVVLIALSHCKTNPNQTTRIDNNGHSVGVTGYTGPLTMDMFGAVTMDYYWEVRDCLKAKDTERLFSLCLQDKAFLLKKGTKVRIIEANIIGGIPKVRVTIGGIDREVYIPRGCLE
jgi:hypothetical protein